MRIHRYLRVPGATGRRAGETPRRAVAMAACLLVLLASGCNLSDIVSPNAPADLTGQNPNQEVEFNGSIVVFFAGKQVAPDGVTDVLITAQARDADGNPVQNGTPISFSTTLGTLRAVGTSPLFAAANITVFSFNGRATVALRSTESGVATVTAAIADVSDFVQIDFEAPPLSGTLSLALSSGSTTGDFTAPADVTVVATARDDSGSPIVGAIVRFRIVQDRTLGSGVGGARFLGTGSSRTDSSGTATEVVRVKGEGSVVVEAELEDPDDGATVAVSNQVIIVTEDLQTTTISLVFDDGSQSTSGTVPFNIGLVATVLDEDGDPVAQVRVKFRITEGDANGSLATTAASRTNSAGEAFNTLNVEAVGNVVVVADLLDDAGTVVATSNQVVATGES